MGNDPAQIVIDRIAYLLRQNGGAVLGRKKRVVIHAVAFSNDAGQVLLRRIARDSEGTFRYVPVGGN